MNEDFNIKSPIINKMMVYVEPDCKSCEKVIKTAKGMHKNKLIKNLLIINREEYPELCSDTGIIIYPAVFIEGELTFYGEFSIEDALNYAKPAPGKSVST